ncbi:MAG: PQQ-like beta-propeller repeat protein, partial [Verrucomicrobiae bacterium]|nr:PQQ-like beta-propeller repeat protein [Verrucomicrobiae bacterium]
SLMLADDKLIVLTETGELIICKAQPTRFESLARAKVLDGRCWVVPVLANGRLYCRNNQGTLVCLDLSGK